MLIMFRNKNTKEYVLDSSRYLVDFKGTVYSFDYDMEIQEELEAVVAVSRERKGVKK